jgi:hypothetical protein
LGGALSRFLGGALSHGSEPPAGTGGPVAQPGAPASPPPVPPPAAAPGWHQRALPIRG